MVFGDAPRARGCIIGLSTRGSRWRVANQSPQFANCEHRYADNTRLAYLLYTLCERKGLAEDARVYNELATAWNDIVTSSIENAKPVLKQAVLDL